MEARKVVIKSFLSVSEESLLMYFASPPVASSHVLPLLDMSENGRNAPAMRAKLGKTKPSNKKKLPTTSA